MKVLDRIVTALLGLMLGLTVALTGATSASAAISDRIIKNGPSSERSMTVCENWDASKCASGSRKGTLNRGENSRTKFGWADTDGLYVPAGCILRDVYEKKVATGPRWLKVSGGIPTTYTARIDCSNV